MFNITATQAIDNLSSLTKSVLDQVQTDFINECNLNINWLLPSCSKVSNYQNVFNNALNTSVIKTSNAFEVLIDKIVDGINNNKCTLQNIDNILLGALSTSPTLKTALAQPLSNAIESIVAAQGNGQLAAITLKGVLVGYKATVIQALNDLRRQLSSAIASSFADLSSNCSLLTILPKLTAIKNKILSTSQQFISTLTNNLASLSKGVSTILNILQDPTVLIDAILKLGSGITETCKELITNSIDTVASKLNNNSLLKSSDIENILKQITTDMSAGINNIKTNLLNAINSCITGLDTSLSTVASVCKNAISAVDGTLGEVFNDVLTSIVSAISDVKGDDPTSVTDLKTILNMFPTIVTNLLDSIQADSSNIFSEALSSLQGSLENGSTSGAKVIQALGNLKDKVFSTLTTNLSGLTNPLSNILSLVNNRVSSVLDPTKLTKVILNIANAILDQISSPIASIISKIKNDVATGADISITDLVNIANNFKNQGMDLINDLQSGITSAFGNLINSLPKDLSNVENLIDDSVKNLEAPLKDAVKDVLISLANDVKAIKGDGQEAVEEFVNCLSSLLSAVPKIMKTIQEKSNAPLGGLIQDLSTLLANGPLSPDKVVSALENLGNNIASAMTSVPSTIEEGLTSFGDIMNKITNLMPSSSEILLHLSELGKELMAAGQSAVQNNIKNVMNNLPDWTGNLDPSKLPELLLNIFSSATSPLTSLQDATLEKLTNLANAPGLSLSNAKDLISSTITGMDSGVADALKTLLNGLVAQISQVKGLGEEGVNDFKQQIGNISSFIKSSLGSLLPKMEYAANDLALSITELVSAGKLTKDALKSALSGVVTNISSIVSGIVVEMTSGLTTGLNVVTDLANGLLGGSLNINLGIL